MTSTGAGLGISAKSDAIFDLVAEGSIAERVAGGFTFTEGPIWHPTEQHLLFSDLADDVRRKYAPDGTVSEVRNFSYKCNGMTYDADLDLIVCEHVTSAVVRESADGRRELLAYEFDGEELNSPNDVCVHSSGAIYFTDPFYGRLRAHGHARKRRLGFQGVYRASPDGLLELVADRDEFEMPNGVCFSPDESLLYVDDTPRAHVKVFEVAPDGSVGDARIFFEGISSGATGEGWVDGMKCDERGNVWVTGPGGVWVLSPSGEHLGTILVPEGTSNLTWGGPDWRELFVTASTSLYSIRTLVGPRMEPYMLGEPRRPSAGV
jgi:gluconolactonase